MLEADYGSAVANKEAFLKKVKVLAVAVNVEWLIVADTDDYVTTRKVCIPLVCARSDSTHSDCIPLVYGSAHSDCSPCVSHVCGCTVTHSELHSPRLCKFIPIVCASP